MTIWGGVTDGAGMAASVPPLLNPLPRRGEGTRLKDVLVFYKGSWVVGRVHPLTD